MAETLVLWVRGHGFWLELRRIGLKDHQWWLDYLESAERRANYRLAIGTSNKNDLGCEAVSPPVRING